MAWTTTKNAEFAAGNQKIQLWKLTADSATLELDTGLDVITHIEATPALAASAPVHFNINETSAAVANNGAIAVTGAASSDEFFVTVYGR